MENEILDSLDDLGYSGPLLKNDTLKESIKQGPKSPEFTKLVEWLTKELQVLLQLEETVNSITDPEDYSSFLVELNAFLKEMCCPHRCLTEGATKDKLQTSESLYTLLDYLCSELQAARMLEHRKTTDTKMKVEMNESATAGALKEMMITLNISKPPATVTSKDLFAKVEDKIQEVLQQPKSGAGTVAVVGRPLFSGVLSTKQWDSLSTLQQQMHKEYAIRRDLLLKRLDVTVQSFKWGDRLKSKTDAIVRVYEPKRKAMKGEPDVLVAHVLAAREDLAIIEKTSSARVLKNTQCDVKKVMIGRVPDRGGRPEDQRAPPPEMPSWQKRTEGPPRGRGGGGPGGGSAGGGRGGGRVQGNWSNQQSNNASYDGGWDKQQTNQQGYQQPQVKQQYQQQYQQPNFQQQYQQPNFQQQYQQPNYQQPHYQQPPQHFQQPNYQQYQQPYIQPPSFQEQAMQSTYTHQGDGGGGGRGHRGKGGHRGGRGGYDAAGSYGASQRGKQY